MIVQSLRLAVAGLCVSGCLETSSMWTRDADGARAPADTPEGPDRGLESIIPGSTERAFAIEDSELFAANTSEPMPMILRPGSVVATDFPGMGLADEIFVVGSDGMIELPGFTWIPADGMTVGELTRTLTAVMQADPALAGQPVQARVRLMADLIIHVEGAVNAPGAFAFVAGATARDAVAAAGGLGRHADARGVTVWRGGEPLRHEYSDGPFSLRPGDVIEVNAAS